MKLRGLALISLAVAIPLLWTIPLTAQHNTAGIISQYFGSVALILMGITQLLATRIRGIETLFGSLDRVYVLHKWLGIGALVTAFLHAEIDADAGNILLARNLGDLAEGLGEVSYNGLIVLLLISLITIIPYKYWKWSHRFIGIFFALAAFHFIYVAKPYAVFDFPGLYVTFFCLMGIVSYLYLLIPRIIGHNTSAYTVTNVVQHGDVTEVNLTPKGRGIRHKAGQFAFVNFAPLTLREAHPFTISSAPRQDGTLRFMIKGLGGYTKRLGTTLEPDMTARVSSAFGHFSLRETKSPQIWIGAGIGITPFMAWTQALTNDSSTPTHLYYCVRTPDDALCLDEFEQAANRVESFDFTSVVSQTGQRLTAEQILTDLSSDIHTAQVFYCGPTEMRETLRGGLIQQGLHPAHFHYEEFEMRTSIGLVRFLRRCLRLGTNTSMYNRPVSVG